MNILDYFWPKSVREAICSLLLQDQLRYECLYVMRRGIKNMLLAYTTLFAVTFAILPLPNIVGLLIVLFGPSCSVPSSPGQAMYR